MRSVMREHITTTRGVSGGKPHITGSRIRVMDIVLWQTKCGWSPDEIVSQFPQLTLADVHAALAYYWDHKEEIETDIRAAEKIETKSRGKHPSILKKRAETKKSEVLSRRARSKGRR